jgi:16S rRNA G966 N2-methylase RsmD
LSDQNLPTLLESNGIFVLEKRPSENVPSTKLWQIDRQKAYGATEVLFLSVIK